MSNRVTAFETHAFHASWESLKAEMKNMDISTITDKAMLEEFGRLEKVIEYIGKYIKLIDPDINVTNIVAQLNNFKSYTDSTISHLRNFNNQKHMQHLNQANAYIDHCLSTIQPMQTILPKVSGQGIHSMLKKYNDTLAEGLDQINLEKTIEYSEKIALFKKELIDGIGEEESIETQIDNMFHDTKVHHEEVVEFYNKIFISDEHSLSIEESVSSAADNIYKHVKETEENITELSNKIKKLSEFYVEIYGELAENGERSGGLKLELEKRIKTLDDFEKEQQKVHKETLKKKLNEITNYEKDVQLHNKNLFEQIKSLLPSATSAGLATAYNEERAKFKKPIFWWNIVFITSLVIISIVSFLTLKDLQTVEDFGKSILHSLPISGPLIWLAIYASKRRSENQRLEQEYAHKEALAKSYSGYKQQIEGLNQYNQELLMQLLNTAITAMSYNASDTLDKKHGDGTPVQEIAKSFMSELQKVIPKG